MSDDYLPLAERFIAAIERVAIAVERVAANTPEAERCPECQSTELDEIVEGGGLIALQCAGCGHSWFPPEDDGVETAEKEAPDALQH